MNNTIPAFNGAVPQNYEDYLGSFLFQPFAEDLAVRIEFEKSKNILELACGTGRLTRVLAEKLRDGSMLTATDLNQDMIAVARKLNSSAHISWHVADMTDIPYPENTFDLVLSQFGVMLVPEKDQALAEAYRVLEKNGRLIFSVWGDIEENQAWQISAEVINSFFEPNLWKLYNGPFSMADEQKVFLQLEKAGFKNYKAEVVNVNGIIDTAEDAAKGFIHGLPVVAMINQQKPELLLEIEMALLAEMKLRLGDHPLVSRLQALIFTAIK